MTNGEILKGIFGSGTTLGAAWVSCLPNIEAGLRIASLIVGLTIGIVTLHGMIQKRKNRK
jgi:zona occludens toxin (predicted ATPase)